MFSGVEILSSTSGGSSYASLFETGANAERIGQAANATPVVSSLTLGESSRGGTDTNVSGSNGTLSLALGTGSSLGAKLLINGPNIQASGTTQQVATLRQVLLHTTANLITNNTATLFARSNAANSTTISVIVRYTVEVNDGTNTQVETGLCTFNAAVATAGTQTLGTPTKSGNVQALGSGTLTVTFTAVTNGSSVDLKIASNSSLTPTVHRALFEIVNLSGVNNVTLF